VKLDAIADQPRAVEQLTRALATNRVAHAYAFVGPTGSGRFTTALAFASELLCEHSGATPRPEQATLGATRASATRSNTPTPRPEQATLGATRASATRSNSCECRACRLVESRQHPDLHVVVPTPPESNPKGARAIRIGAVRELERQAMLRPMMARRRVLVLDEAERMTGESPQAFLKFLEEPPPETVVVLILPRARALPATVISRCQLVRFRGRDEAAAPAAVAEAAAALDEAREQGAPAIFKRTERVDRERAEALISGCWLHCRDLMLLRAGAAPALLTDASRADSLATEAAEWTDEGLYAAIEACREAHLALAGNVTPRLTVDVMLGRLAGRGV
jgi:DNA polymerase III subunit delta'